MRKVILVLAIVCSLLFVSQASAYVYTYRIYTESGTDYHYLTSYNDDLTGTGNNVENVSYGPIALNNSSGDVYARRSDATDNYFSRYNSSLAYQAPQMWGMDYNSIAVNSGSGDVYVVRADGSADYLTEYSSDLSSQQDQIWEWQSNVTFEQVAVNNTSGDVYLVQNDSDEPYNYLKRYNSGLVYQNQDWTTDYKELAVNQGSGDVYVVRNDGSDSYLSRYNSALVYQSQTSDVTIDSVFAINSITGDVYVERVDGSGDHYLTRYNSSLTSILTQIDAGQDLIDITVNSLTGDVYVIRVDGAGDQYLSRFDSSLVYQGQTWGSDHQSIVANDVVPEPATLGLLVLGGLLGCVRRRRA